MLEIHSLNFGVNGKGNDQMNKLCLKIRKLVSIFEPEQFKEKGSFIQNLKSNAYVHCFLPWLACVCTFCAASGLFLNPITHVYLQKLVQPKKHKLVCFRKFQNCQTFWIFIFFSESPNSNGSGKK